MDFVEFCKRGKEMVDFIVNYMDIIVEWRVIVEVDLGYLRNWFFGKFLRIGDKFEDIMNDVERVIMLGVSIVIK